MITLPSLQTGHAILDRAFRIALGDLCGNIQLYKDGLLDKPSPCLLAGLDYDTPWTRDAAINSWYGLGLISPQVAYNTLLSVLIKDPAGIRIGGQYWDAIIWVTGAWQYYLHTGNRSLLALAYIAARNAISYFEKTEYDPEDGLFRGAACFQDGVAAYPDEFTTPDFQSSILEWVNAFPDKRTPSGFGLPMKTLSTNCLYFNAYQILPQMAEELGWTAPIEWKAKADALKVAINKHFWDNSIGMYRYLVGVDDTQDRQEGFGNAFALLFGVADHNQSQQVLENQVNTSHGIPCLWPTYERYSSTDGMSFGRHSGTIWPQVNAAWAEATVIHHRPELAIFELNTLAEKACLNMQFHELYHPVSGKPYGGLQEDPQIKAISTWESCNRQSWCASGYLHMVLKVLFGMRFSTQGITFQPNLPEGIDTISIKNLAYRNAILEVRVMRGKEQQPTTIPADSEGNIFVEVSALY